MRRRFMILAGISALLLGGCGAAGDPIQDCGEGVQSYTRISQDEARAMMEMDDGHIIVDVRTQEEYEEGHIPGAVCIPNEDISDMQPDALPDLDQVILVYCRSGRQSKEAAQKLFDIGYTNVYEFGGIIDWTGEITRGEQADMEQQEDMEQKTDQATLSFDSFDGGGPQFDIYLAEEIVSCTEEVKYRSGDHGNMTGSGFTVNYTFTGITPGETGLRIEARSPIAGNYDYEYLVSVDESLRVTIREVRVRDLDGEEEMRLFIGEEEVPVIWEYNESVEALKKLCPLEIRMSMYGGFEQVGSIGESLPRDDAQMTTGCGDIVLYSGNQIVVFYGSNSWSYTGLGHIDLPDERVEELLAEGEVTIRLD